MKYQKGTRMREKFGTVRLRAAWKSDFNFLSLITSPRKFWEEIMTKNAMSEAAESSSIYFCAVTLHLMDLLTKRS